MDLSYSSPSPRQNNPFADAMAAKLQDTSLNAIEAQNARSIRKDRVRAQVPEQDQSGREEKVSVGF
ncbi:hypothetical protein N7491_005444 [Penicillium cf. griseofulvum]|uniref:Uncharacterized protein n=1 Tax=Penicillium cf. griseofulvum TaxID=2972120 RepID=A0A9W9J1V2_9EURO|nr:hypothetical protein N7472_008133 [Penicillium cf. griseofulvum]KAJ5434849.1 hypothetical protein N7491_005444 [Penicillium cf. griseofulvum]KAJ5452680.1 hypothetical protein N7445_000863 [Penicillium cf. griseofulvum]